MSDTYARFVANEFFPFVTNYPDIKSKYTNLEITDDLVGLLMGVVTVVLLRSKWHFFVLIFLKLLLHILPH